MPAEPNAVPKPNRTTLACVAAWMCAAAVLAGASRDRPAEPLFTPRVTDVRVDRVSLERVDISLQMAVRSSRDVTLRTLKFSDGFVDRIPVWVTPIEGRWPLRRGEEFVIPTRVAITAYARDALGAASLAELIGRKEVDARAVVEVSFDTPWLARLLGTATNIAVTDVAFAAPVPAMSLPQPLAQLGAGMLEFLQRQAAPMLATGPGGQAGNRAVLDRFGRSVAAVETAYELEGAAVPARRTVSTLGVWWTPSTYCTTREALEPWRYSPAEASLMQVDGARLRDAATTMQVRTAGGVPIALDAAALRRQLPKLQDRRVYSLATGERRRMRLAVRTAPSALVCLRLRDEDGPALPSASAPVPAAAFAGEPSRGLVWTDAVLASESMLTLRTPVHRQSLGSPLVTADGVVGLVASPDAAWDARAIAQAAARALRVSPPSAGRASTSAAPGKRSG